MTIEFTCPRCPTRYRVPDALAGRKASCKQCSTEFLVPSPFARLAKTDPARARTGDSKPGDAVTGGGQVKQAGRPFSMLIALGALALIGSMFLPWVQSSLTPIGMLGYPQGGVAPFQLATSGTSLDALGVDTAGSQLSALARFGLLLIPLAGLLVLVREGMTASKGAVPRLSLLTAAILPFVAALLCAVGFAQSRLTLQDGESVARAVQTAALENASNPDSPMALATAGLRAAKDQLSVGLVVCGLGVLLVLAAAVFTRAGEKATAAATSSGSGGALAPVPAGAAQAPGAAGTMMFRNESDRGRTSILQASAAAATTAALATLVRNGNGGSSPAARAERAAAAAVGTAAAIEQTLAVVETAMTPASDSVRAAAATAAATGVAATEVLATEVVPTDTVPAARALPAPPAADAPDAHASDAALDLPAPIAAAPPAPTAMTDEDLADPFAITEPDADTATKPNGNGTTDPFGDPFGDLV